MGRDAEQEALDYQDMVALMRRLLGLRADVDLAAEEVASLTVKLKGARKRLKEAGWQLAACELRCRSRFGLAVASEETRAPAGSGQRGKGGKPMISE